MGEKQRSERSSERASPAQNTSVCRRTSHKLYDQGHSAPALEIIGSSSECRRPTSASPDRGTREEGGGAGSSRAGGASPQLACRRPHQGCRLGGPRTCEPLERVCTEPRVDGELPRCGSCWRARSEERASLGLDGRADRTESLAVRMLSWPSSLQLAGVRCEGVAEAAASAAENLSRLAALALSLLGFARNTRLQHVDLLSCARGCLRTCTPVVWPASSPPRRSRRPAGCESA